MKWLRFCALTTAIAVVSMLAGPAGASVADFYKNKKINIYIGSTPGGGYDQYARLVGRHMGQYIPGKPSFVPKNMPGASGRRALSYVYTVAPKDGTAVGVVLRGTIFDPLFYPKKAIKVDATKITWIGSANSEVTTCVAWAATGIKSLDDLKTRGMIVGATGPNSTDTVFAKLLNRVAGTKIKVITGYPGSTQVHLAMERGEVDGRCGLGWDSIVARKQDWMRDKKINILVQLAMKPHKDLPNTLFAMTLARNDKERKMMELFFAPNLMGRPFFAPPDLPKDRVQALQAAFMKTMGDKGFLAEAKKLKVAINPLSGPKVAALVKKIYNTPADVVAAARDILTSRKGVSKRKTNYYTVKVKLLGVNRKGSKIQFMDKGKKVKASVSGRRTKVTIGGNKAKRKALKKGMSCAVTYEGHRTLAKTVTCN